MDPNKMDGEQKFFLNIVVSVIIGLLFFCGLIQYHYRQKTQMYINGGYTLRALPGIGNPRWVKIDPNE